MKSPDCSRSFLRKKAPTKNSVFDITVVRSHSRSQFFCSSLSHNFQPSTNWETPEYHLSMKLCTISVVILRHRVWVFRKMGTTTSCFGNFLSDFLHCSAPSLKSLAFCFHVAGSLCFVIFLQVIPIVVERRLLNCQTNLDFTRKCILSKCHYRIFRQLSNKDASDGSAFVSTQFSSFRSTSDF